MKIDLKNLPPAQRQNWLQHAIAPRPICFASTIDKAGQVNLSPFSFFNLFSSNPPIVVFSPARRVRDNTPKHTLENVLEVPEVVINIVDYSMVQQVSLSSCEYPKGINEFNLAGFTPISSDCIKPPRVAESKVQMECRVIEVKPLGHEGGAGNLVICEVLIMHIADDILNADGSMIDQKKLQHVARLGGDWYCKVDESNLFHVAKPNQQLGIGFEQLPYDIRNSFILTGNQLAQLANVETLPFAEPSFYDPHVKEIIQYFSPNPEEMELELHRHAAHLLDQGKVKEAWQVLLVTTSI
jgi:flavin reductase (DIM6/NTAB) family NADH-FMN oxidoreductase RutF